MPDQNNQNPDQNQQNGLGTVPMVPQSDIPPLPTDFSAAPATPPVATTPEPLITTTPIPGQESGSAAPPAPAFSDITAPPKKKFGGGKIIATILGIFVLVGGVAAAVLTINQKQLFQQKAAEVACDPSVCPRCGCGCHAPTYADCAGGVGNSCNICTPAPTQPGGAAPTCEQNGFTCVVGGCPAGSYSQTGSCTNGVCCSTPLSTPKSGWGTGIACQNTSGTGDHCILITCPNGCVGGCSENDPGATVKSGDCGTLSAEVVNICGQVDLVNASGVYCHTTSNTDAQISCPQPKCAIKSTNPPTNPTPTPTPTTPSVAPFCAAISTYDSDWNLMSSTDRSSLKAGDMINLCVTGSAATGTFDMARFIINGVQQTDTTATRPNSTDFCQSYTLPEGTATFTVSAQIHHSSGVWY